MQPNTPVATQPSTSFDQQLSDIKSQAAKLVTAAQKKDPKIQISTANAEMIGLPKVNIPTQKKDTPTPSELSMVGTTIVPKTSQDVARETILSQVPEADRDTISQILGVATGYQTEKGQALESTAESLMTQQLSNIQSTRDKALESSKMKETAMLPELEAELESIRGEADVLEARRNSAIQAESRRQGVSTAAQTGNVNAIDRDFNLEKANLAIRELASVGKINAATKLIDTKLDLKYGDLEAETALLTAQINAISPFLTREDTKAAETRLQLNDIVKNKIADARAEDKAIEEFKLQSYLFAQQNGATPATLSQIMSSTSREDVASVGGSFIQDPLTKSQLYTQSLQQQQLRNELNAPKTTVRDTQVVNGKLIDMQTGEIVADFSGGSSLGEPLSYEDNAKFNATPEAKAVKDATNYASSVKNYKSAIETHGTGEVFGKGSGVLNEAYSALVGATKDYYGLGTYDDGVKKLIAIGIPEPTVWGLKSGRISALDSALNTAKGKIEKDIKQLGSTQYSNSLEFNQLKESALNVVDPITGLQEDDLGEIYNMYSSTPGVKGVSGVQQWY